MYLVMDEDKYVGHCLIDYSQLIQKRAEIDVLYIDKKYRSPFWLLGIWFKLEEELKRIGVKRLQVHAVVEEVKWRKTLEYICGFKEECIRKEYAWGRDYVLLYQLLEV